MKMVREKVDAVVLFEKNIVRPMVVNCSLGSLKILKIIRKWRERRNLKECLIYLCQANGKEEPVELKWELESNIWYMEKY